MSQPAAPPGLPRNVKVVGLASLVNDVAGEMIFPLLGTFLTTVLGGTLVHLGWMEGVVDSTSSLLKLFSGGWSDRAGRRKGFVVFGYSLAALTRPLVGLATAPWQLFLVRTGDRIGKGLRTAPRDALIADSTPPEMRGRAFGFHRAMDHLGAAIGPLFAALFLWVWPDRLRELFLLAVVPGVIVVVVIVVGLREPPATAAGKPPLRLSLAPFDRNFRLYLLALVVFTLGNSSDLFLLKRAEELGVPVWLLPVLWAAFHVLKSGGNMILGGVVDRVGPRPLLFLGWGVYAGIYLGFALAAEAWHAWAFFLAYALFYGLTEPAEKTLVADLVGPDVRGLAFGWFNFALGVAALPANVVFGYLYERSGALAAFGWGAGLAAVAALLLLGVRAGPRATSA